MSNTKKSTKKKSSVKETKKGSSPVLSIIIIILAIIFEASNINLLGQLGAWLKYGQFGLFGVMAYIFPICLVLLVIFNKVLIKHCKKKIVCVVIIFICLCAFLHLITGMDMDSSNIGGTFSTSATLFTGGGIIGGFIAIILGKAVSTVGAYIIIILAIIISIIILTEFPVAESLRRISNRNDYDEDDDGQYEFDTKKNRKSAPVKETKKAEPIRNSRNSQRELTEENNRPQKVVRVYNVVDNDGILVGQFTKDGDGRKKASQRKSEPVKRANLSRSNNKGKSMRSEESQAKLKRSGNKKQGISEQIQVNPGSTSGDEVREITRRGRKKENINIEKKPEKKIVVKDVEPETVLIDELAAEPKVAAKKVNASKPKERATLSGKQFSDPLSEKKESSIATKDIDYKSQVVPAGIKKASLAKPGSISKDGYKFPPLDLLDKRKGKSFSGENLAKVSKELEDILREFGVNAEVVDAQSGPSVTRYEIQPERGTRVNKITQLADDLKLNLAVPDIRIEAPIPGKAAVGIEIPNKNKSVVLMRDLLEDSTLLSHPSKIAYAAGKDISGNVVVSDIAKMPHMLIAGTTGSGKSVFVNTILMTILYRAKPSEVGLIIIDPKQVEFGVYRGIPHLIQDVVTDPAQAVSTLRWAVAEMASRYNRMALSGVKDFQNYNKKFDSGKLNPEEENPKRMGQIVIIIDELADLMMVASKEVEGLICRLAQLARAAGIHLIIATQRPSVDVVTGLIKANIPARVALLVASGTDSRTIIDMNGAEKLLGYGDMLFYPTGYVKPVRVQGAYVSEKEIANTIEYIKANNESGYYDEEAKSIEEYKNGSTDGQMSFGNSSSDDSGSSSYDEHFYEAGMLCIETGKASSSMLQRRFNIGFNRAARIIDQLEEIGVIGPQNGAKPRDILVDSMTFEEKWQEINS